MYIKKNNVAWKCNNIFFLSFNLSIMTEKKITTGGEIIRIIYLYS
jgi:hypothetical protein